MTFLDICPEGTFCSCKLCLYIDNVVVVFVVKSPQAPEDDYQQR